MVTKFKFLNFIQACRDFEKFKISFQHNLHMRQHKGGHKLSPELIFFSGMKKIWIKLKIIAISKYPLYLHF